MRTHYIAQGALLNAPECLVLSTAETNPTLQSNYVPKKGINIKLRVDLKCSVHFIYLFCFKTATVF